MTVLSDHNGEVFEGGAVGGAGELFVGDGSCVETGGAAADLGGVVASGGDHPVEVVVQAWSKPRRSAPRHFSRATAQGSSGRISTSTRTLARYETDGVVSTRPAHRPRSGGTLGVTGGTPTHERSSAAARLVVRLVVRLGEYSLTPPESC